MASSYRWLLISYLQLTHLASRRQDLDSGAIKSANPLALKCAGDSTTWIWVWSFILKMQGNFTWQVCHLPCRFVSALASTQKSRWAAGSCTAAYRREKSAMAGSLGHAVLRETLTIWVQFMITLLTSENPVYFSINFFDHRIIFNLVCCQMPRIKLLPMEHAAPSEPLWEGGGTRTQRQSPTRSLCSKLAAYLCSAWFIPYCYPLRVSIPSTSYVFSRKNFHNRKNFPLTSGDW